MTYILPRLPYAYDALEPFIDEATMRVHHDGHHKTYVETLDKVMKDHPGLRKRVEELLASVNTLPVDIRDDVLHNAGGHANHSVFWTVLSPQAPKEPEGDLHGVMESKFGSFAGFREKFSDLATNHFSNGWAWLCASPKEGLTLLTTKDHDSPITLGLTPLLVLDLWEHAYYLKHQNRRAEYVQTFWDIVNWPEVALRWQEFQKTGASVREWRMAS
jgi:superoxide dismutase, Fe-Mn family